MNLQNDDELLACFHQKNLPDFHTGELSPIIFPMEKKSILDPNISRIGYRIFALTRDKYFLIEEKSLQRTSHEKYCSSSISGYIHYSSPFSYSTIKKEAQQELEKLSSFKLIFFRFLDFFLDEKHIDGSVLIYNFLALIEKNDTLNNKLDSKFTKYLSEAQLRRKLENASFEENSKKYWLRILQDNLIEKLVEKSNNIKLSKKNVEIGALIGRFQPFHNGHLQLILSILSQPNSFLKIGIGSSQYSNTRENPFSYDERKQFIIQSLQSNHISSKRYQIYSIPDLHNMEKWVDRIIDIFDNFDVFYSNNDWIRELVIRVGKNVGEKIIFEFDRFNGSKIRKLIAENKPINDLIPPSVEQYILKINGLSRVKKLFQIIKN